MKSRRPRIANRWLASTVTATLAAGVLALAISTENSVEVVSSTQTDHEGAFVATQGRILDTRGATALGTTWRSIQVAGKSAIPNTDVSAVAVTITAISPSAAGWVQAVPSEVTQTSTVSLNFASGGTVSNSAIVKLGADGKINLRASTSVHVLVDIQGYYTASASGSGYIPVQPQRVADTRTGLLVPQAKLTANSTVALALGGIAGVPADADAVVVNLTAVNPTASGHFVPYAAGASAPPSVSLNFPNLPATAIGATLPLGTNGNTDGVAKLDVKNANVDLVVDVVGYYASDTRHEGGFHAASGRVLANQTVPPGATYDVQITGQQSIPAAGVRAAAVHLSVNPGNGNGHLSAWNPSATEPATSVLNYRANQVVSNSAIVATSAGGKIRVKNHGAVAVQLFVDTEGWFENFTNAAPASPTAILAGSTSESVVRTATPTISALSIDPEDDDIAYSFDILVNDEIVWSGQSAFVPSGQPGSVTVPSGVLSAGTHFAVRASARDAFQAASGLSATSEFTVAQVPPTPGNLIAGPRTTGAAVVSTSPVLEVQIPSSTSFNLTLNFRVKAGANEIWTGTIATSPGTKATIQVPSSAGLQAGQSYTWQAWLVDGSGAQSGVASQTVTIGSVPTALVDQMVAAATIEAPVVYPGLINADGILKRTLWSNFQAATSACMNYYQHPYQVAAVPPAPHTTPSASDGYGISSSLNATPSLSPATANAISQMTASQKATYYTALFGNSSQQGVASDGVSFDRAGSAAATGGCESLARHFVVTPTVGSWAVENAALADLMSDLEGSGDFTAAQAQWSDCMTALGYSYVDYREPMLILRSQIQEGVATQSLEMSTANDDLDCRTSSGLSEFFADNTGTSSPQAASRQPQGTAASSDQSESSSPGGDDRWARVSGAVGVD